MPIDMRYSLERGVITWMEARDMPVDVIIEFLEDLVAEHPELKSPIPHPERGMRPRDG